MTAAPNGFAAPGPPRLLTVAEYAALGETEFGYTELIEGRLLMSPSPAPDHAYASTALLVAITSALPAGFEVLPETDLDLELAAADKPGFVRRPDLMVIRARARRRVRDYGGLLRASDVLLAIEVVSPGSRRIDRVDKRGEYADAGIPHYWIVDIDQPVSITACHLAGEFGYADGGEVTGVFRVDEPFAFELALDRLL